MRSPPFSLWLAFTVAGIHAHLRIVDQQLNRAREISGNAFARYASKPLSRRCSIGCKRSCLALCFDLSSSSAGMIVSGIARYLYLAARDTHV